MTVTYTKEVATCRGVSCFLKLLLRWKASIYKLVYMDLFMFLFLYYSLNLLYRLGLNQEQRGLFENIVSYCNTSANFIPLSFVLGFYVTIVMTRWWNQYMSIPFPDSLAVYVSATIHGQEERGRIMRRTIMRYVCLSSTMLFTNISPKVKKRFPTLNHLVTAGLLEESEQNVMDRFNQKFPTYSKHWMPLVWASSIIMRARKEGMIRDDFAVKTMLDEINKFRARLGTLVAYDMISIPLVYTQVVTLAVYTYFVATLMGQQWIDDPKYKFTLYFPVFTLLQFFFYMGWLKVAESLINPFGDDDDDFELNWMVDRNIQISYMIVDEMHHEHPELIRDQYWDEILPDTLPYTPESEPFRESHPLPSTANIAGTYQLNNGFSGRSIHKLDDLGASGIIFQAKQRFGGSQHSIAGSIRSFTRTNSFINPLRKLFNRSDSNSTDPEELLHTIPRRVIVDVIEEVDEQLTMIAKREEPVRPAVYDIFKDNTQKTDRLEVPEDKSYLSPNFVPIPEEDTEDSFTVLRDQRKGERLKRIKHDLVKYLENKDE